MRRKGGHLPLEQPKPLAYASPETVSAVLPNLEEQWSRNALGLQQRLRESIEANDALNAVRWATAGGISTDKTLLLKGRPTEIVANLHAHRHELVDVMDKLAIAARVLSTHQRKGYARVIPSGADVPVSHLPLDAPKSVIITHSASDQASE